MKVLEKTIASVLAIVVLFGCFVTSMAEESVLKAWHFTDSVPEDIDSGPKVTASVTDGILTLQATNKLNASFYLGTPGKPLNFGGGEIKKLKLRMKISGEKTIDAAPFLIGYPANGGTTTKTAEWQTDDNGAEIVYGGDFADYVFDLTKLPDLSDEITLTQLIIQPMRLSRTGIISFESIEIIGEKKVIMPSVSLKQINAKDEYQIGDILQFDVTVKNADAIGKVELVVNGNVAETVNQVPCRFNYELTQNGDYTFFAKVTLADDTIISSEEISIVCAEHQEQIFREWNFDDNTIPSDIGRSSKTTFSAEYGALKVVTTAGFQSVNISPYTQLNFTTKKYRYLKLTVKNMMKSEQTADPVALIIHYTDGSSATYFYQKDVSGKEIYYNDSFYRQYIFDMEQEKDKSEKPIAWIEAYLFRCAKSGTAYIDNICISDTASYAAVSEQATLLNPQNGSEFSLGQEVTLSAAVSTGACEGVDYYVNQQFIGSGSGADDTLSYTFRETGTHKIKAIVKLSDGTNLETQTVSVSVTVSNAAQGKKWEFDSGLENWYTNGSLATLKVADGAMVATYNSGAAQAMPICIDGLSIDGSKCSYLKIRMKNQTTSAKLQFQWKLNNGSFANDLLFQTTHDSNNVPITANDTEFKEYVFSLKQYSGWQKNVTTIQFHPAVDARSGTVYIDSIEVYDVLPQVELSVNGGAVYPEPVVLTPKVQKADYEIERTDLYLNGKVIKTYQGTDCTPYTVIPLDGGEITAFVAAYDERGEVTFGEPVSFHYDTPFLFGEWKCTIAAGVANIEVPVKRVLQEYDSLVIAAVAYDAQGSLIASDTVDADATDVMTNATLSLAIPDKTASVTVYAWDSLHNGESYHKPMTVKVVD